MYIYEHCNTQGYFIIYCGCELFPLLITWCSDPLKPRSHQSRTQHGPSRITPEHPGPRDALIRGEPGWKCFDGPSTDDGRSKNIVYTDSTWQHYGSTRSQHGWPRTTTAALRTVPDRPRTMPDPTRCQHGWSRTTPDHPGCATDSPGPLQTQHGPPRTVPYQKHFCINRAAVLFYFLF